MFYKSFFVTGLANKTVLDSGLISTVEEPLTIQAVIIDVSSHQDNVIEGWIETNRILSIYDKVLSTSYFIALEGAFHSTNKIIRIPINEIIKPGMIFKIGINSGAIPANICGAYEYIKTP